MLHATIFFLKHNSVALSVLLVCTLSQPATISDKVILRILTTVKDLGCSYRATINNGRSYLLNV